jgi:AmmeMemoRadiSam system protein B
LISPHIDYQRGGPIYAGVWEEAADALRAADLVIIFGTDHAGSAGQITPTRQNYATPYGVLPTDTALVDAIAAAIGEEAAFAEEIHHRGEHSIELAAVWLHHMRNGQSCQVLPILCGSFQHFVAGQADPATDPVLNASLDVLQKAIAGRRVVVVAAADLAHVGPAFSHPFPVDHVRYAQLQAADEILIQTIADADASAFFRTIAAEGDRRNVCGLPPIYLTLRLLEGSVRGELTGYDRCPADGANASFVSVCGLVFHLDA